MVHMQKWSTTYLKADKEMLNSKKELFIDPTLNNYSFTFPNVRPIDRYSYDQRHVRTC